MTRALDRVNRGLIMAVIGAAIAGYIGYGARDHALDIAGDRASRAIIAMQASDPRGANLQKQVAAWVAGSRSRVAYLNVSNADGRLLASAGAWSDWFKGWLSRSSARDERALTYRLLCAESNRPLTGADGAGIGGLRIGIAWWSVLIEAGSGLWLAIVLCLLGLGWAARERRAAAMAAREPTPVHTRSAPGDAQPDAIDNHARPGARFKTRSAKQRVGREASVACKAGFQPIQWRADKPAVEAPARRLLPAEPAPVAAAEDEGQALPVAASVYVEPEETAPAPAHNPAPALCFVPIGQQAADSPPAGAAVILARANEPVSSSWISVERLASSCQSEAEQVALAVRLIGRLAALQANWRTLELPRALLFLTLPPAIFAFDHAVETWTNAFKMLDESTRDLVLCVERIPERIRQTMPVRWALAEPGVTPPTRYRLIPADDNAAGARRSAPIGQAMPVCWPQPGVSAADIHHTPLAPRDFARLLGHREPVF